MQQRMKQAAALSAQQQQQQQQMMQQALLMHQHHQQQQAAAAGPPMFPAHPGLAAPQVPFPFRGSIALVVCAGFSGFDSGGSRGVGAG
jgi:hypothetical protein